MRARGGAAVRAGVLLGWASCVCATAQAAQWSVQEAAADAAARTPHAVIANATGDRLDLYQDDERRVRLAFTAGGAFSGLSPSSCPTIQIDARTPLHHFTLDNGCAIERARAVVSVGRIEGRSLKSMIVHRLMNGDRVSVRYVTADGAYHEAAFTLSRSADAIRSALGRGVRVRAE